MKKIVKFSSCGLPSSRAPCEDYLIYTPIGDRQWCPLSDCGDYLSGGTIKLNSSRFGALISVCMFFTGVTRLVAGSSNNKTTVL